MIAEGLVEKEADLLMSDCPLSDTSRPQREGEVPGQDYHFITGAQFEADILGRKFVEHGEYEKAYYGKFNTVTERGRC